MKEENKINKISIHKMYASRISSKKEEERKEDERQFRDIINNIGAGYFYIDRDGRFQYVNKAWLRMHGYNSPDEVIGQHFALTQVESDLEKAHQVVERLLLGESIKLSESTRRCKDGSISHHVFSANPVIHEGKIIGLEGFLIDIAEKMKMEEELRDKQAHLEKQVTDQASSLREIHEWLRQRLIKYAAMEKERKICQERFNTVAENINVGIYRSEPGHRGRFIEANPAIIKMFGFKNKEEFLRKNVSDLYQNPKDREQFSTRILEQGSFRNKELQLKKKDGTKFFASVSTVAVKNENGKVEYYDGIIEDITIKMKSINVLKKSEKKFKDLAEESPNMIFVSKKDHIAYANKKWREIMGYRQQEYHTPNFNFFSLFASESKNSVKAKFDALTKEEKIARFEAILITKNGERIEALINAKLYSYEGEDALLLIITDITERKHIEKKKDEFLKAIETTLEAICILCSSDKFLYTNDAMDELFGYNKGELIGKATPILNAGPYPEAISKKINDTIKKKDFWTGEIHNKRKDGTEFVSYAKISAVKDKKGKIISYISTQHNITERKIAEEKIKQHQQMLESSRKELEEFSRKILKIREIEKKNLSSVLHDELGCCAISLSSSLAIVEEEIKSKKSKEALKAVKRANAIIQESVIRLKKIAIDLRPPDLDIMGLTDALRDFFSYSKKQSKIKVNFSTNLDKKKVHDKSSITLYRITQEAVNNIIKHANASVAKVMLHNEGNEIRLIICDNGIGFDLKNNLRKNRGHLGILGMKEMAEAMDGTFSIKTNLGKGTQISVLIPNNR